MHGLREIDARNFIAQAKVGSERLKKEIPQAVVAERQVSTTRLIGLVLDRIREIIVREREDPLLATFPQYEPGIMQADLFLRELQPYREVLRIISSDLTPEERASIMAEFTEWAKHATSPEMKSALNALIPR